ncbi:hypothetical protein ACIHFC_35615, partial [Streptomyces sp. NPDC052013]|uniref:hypothetical protein n=1 Tax=Streptomyces sp. NPDC052013 TaxID=3365679 RepID=UPI0037D98FE7
MQYSYLPTTTAAGNEFLLNQITYTYGAGGATGHRWVKFAYEKRPDVGVSFVNGVRYTSSQRLKAIEMWAPNPAATQKVREYLLQYKTMSAGEERRSLLESVQQCGAVGGCLPAKKFTWSAKPALGFNSSTVIGSAGSGLATSGDPGTNAPHMTVSDVNGDGADDVLYQKNGTSGQLGVVSDHASFGQVKPLTNTTGVLNGKGSWPTSLVDFPASRLVDIDNDGKSEVALSTMDLSGVSLKIMRWDAASKTFVATGQEFPGTVNGYDEFADMNGDGLLDHVGGYNGSFAPSGNFEPGVQLAAGMSVRLNQGGSFGPRMEYKLPKTCRNARVADVDGDGKAEILMPSAVTTGSMDTSQGICGVADPNATNTTPGPDPHHYTYGGGGTYALNIGADGKLNGGLSPIQTAQEIGEYATASVSYLNGYVPVQQCGFVDTHGKCYYYYSYEPSYDYDTAEVQNGLYPWKPVIGDFNGDKLKDVVLVPIGHRTKEPHFQAFYPAVFLFNTGAGVSWENASTITIPRDDLADVTARDVDGDGRDDLVSFYNTNLTLDKGPQDVAPEERLEPKDWTVTASGEDRISILLSKGDGSFTTKTMTADAGSAHAGLAGRATSQLGDFDGNGLTDIATISTGNGLMLHTQQDKVAERIVAVSDEGAGWNRLAVDYQHWHWDGRTAWDGGSCTGRAKCVRSGGMLVVKSLTSHEGAVNAAEATAGASDITFFSFHDPVADARQGLLGFGVQRTWRPAQPVETKTLFDVRTTSPDGRHFPFAGMPKTAFTVVPILNPDEVAAHPTGPVKARVTRVDSAPVFRSLNSGKTFAALPSTTTTREWEQNVTVDWDPSLLSNPAHTHNIIGVNNNQDPVARTRMTATTVDNFGNTTQSSQTTVGGVAARTDTDFDYAPQRVEDWLISVPLTSAATHTEGGASTVVHTDYVHDGQGRLTDTIIEKNNADKRLSSTTHLDLSSRGVVTKTTVKADGLPDRITHDEYEPMFAGQPDEDVFVSQTWAEHNENPQYRPSSWQVVHPALGVTQVTMTLIDPKTATTPGRGVAAVTQIDDLGRPTRASTPGARETTYTYSQTHDTTSGAVNGLKVTTANDATTAATISDPAGRTRSTTTTGFDGGTIHTATTYDRLGRVVTQTRPYTTGAAPKLTTITQDSLNRTVKTVGPDNATTTVEYPTFFKTQTTSPRGVLTEAVTDLDGRPSTSTVYYQKDPQDPVPSEATTRYSYTPTTTTVIDPQGSATKTTTDILGRTVKLEDPDRGTTTSTYYGTGDIDTTTHAGTGESST